MNIAIIGPRGVGKSKVSRRLSRLVGIPHITTDMISVYLNRGLSIPEFIEKNNGDWKPFRTLELKIIEHLADANNLILDCGGGILFDIDPEGNEIFSQKKFDTLRKFATIVYLSRDTEYLIEKVKNDPTRPSLSQLSSYREILERRLPYYERAASLVLKINGMSSKQTARILAQKLDLIEKAN